MDGLRIDECRLTASRFGGDANQILVIPRRNLATDIKIWESTPVDQPRKEPDEWPVGTLDSSFKRIVYHP